MKHKAVEEGVNNTIILSYDNASCGDLTQVFNTFLAAQDVTVNSLMMA